VGVEEIGGEEIVLYGSGLVEQKGIGEKENRQQKEGEKG
jgi:hypothetical protein